MALIEYKSNSAFQVTKFNYEGKTFIGIARMYRKRGSKEWHMGKNVAIPYGTEETKTLLSQIIKELQKYEQS